MTGKNRILSKCICVLLIAVPLLSLVSCSAQDAPAQGDGSAQTTSGIQSNETPDQQDDEERKGEETGLVLLSYDDELMTNYANAAYEQFGIQMVLAEVGNEAYEQMLLDFAAGKANFDIVCVSNALGNLYTADGLIDKGYFLSLNDLEHVKESIIHMLPVLQGCVTRNDVIYALPYLVRTKVLNFDRALYDAKADGNTDRYSLRTGKAVSSTWLNQLPDCQEFETWEQLFATSALEEGNGVLASNAILEQYILSADQEGFSFDSESFQKALSLMKTADTLTGPAFPAPARIGINPLAYYTENWDSTGDNSELVLACDDVYAPPTIDSEKRLAMAYDALAINVFSEKKEDALRFLDCAAAIGWKGNGKEEGKETGAIMKFGSPETAACYADAEHIRTVVGDDPENQRRWRELTQRLAPITDAGYLTSFYLEIYPMYRDGAITAEQCARMTQERFEMYKAEQEK